MMAALVEEFIRLRRGADRRVRRWFLGMRCKRFGERVEIADGVLFYYPQFLEIGDRVVVNDGVILQCCEGTGIVIGDDAVLSYGAYVLTGGLQMARGIPTHGHDTAPVHIGPKAWIGAGAILLPGVAIGEGAVVGAGSVVTKDVPEGSKVVGSPARAIP